MKRGTDPDASTALTLEADSDVFPDISDLMDVCETMAHQSSTLTPPTEVCSPSFSPSNASEPSDLTPEEAAELLRVLDASSLSQTPMDVTTEAREHTPPFATAEAAPTRKKPGRKKSPGPRTGKMRNPSRERLQNELAYLRSKTVELEDELKVLQARKRSVLALESSESRNIAAGARVWRRIAERQAREREASEGENKRLKGVLQGQIALAKRLEQMLRKNPQVTVMQGSLGIPKNLTTWGEMHGMYESFLSELDGLYAQIDDVFHRTGLETSVDDSFRHAYVKTRKAPNDGEELYAELQDVTIIPFELERTSSAMWSAVKRQYRKNSYHSYEGAIDRLDDTIAVKYRSQTHRGGKDVSLDALMVMRRYTERGRLAFVWRSVSHAMDEQLSGMYTDETGWSVLKQIPPEAGISLSGSVMHNCVHVVPKRVDCASSIQQNEVGLLTKLVIDCYEDDVVALSAMMEDMLLKDALTVVKLPECTG